MVGYQSMALVEQFRMIIAVAVVVAVAVAVAVSTE